MFTQLNNFRQKPKIKIRRILFNRVNVLYFKKEKGITLVEIVVAIFIITMFSAILIANFPEIKKQYALSNATYKLAQDFRRAQDLGLSAVKLNDKNGYPILVKGYGVYIDLIDPTTTEYSIYADVDNSSSFNNSTPIACDQYDTESDEGDCIIETIDVSANYQDLYIKTINNINDDTSVNFSPPGPTINIENLILGNSEIEIILGLKSDESSTRTILVNKSGLISVQ